MTVAGKEPGIAAHQVFISYASDNGNSSTSDRKVADQICIALESQGIGCWIAHRDILPGAPWMEAITDAVDQTKIIILVFSDNTEKSKWVKDEIGLALEEDKTIIPFRIQDVYPRRALKLLKIRCHWMDAFTQPLEEHLEQLAAAVRKHLGITPAMPPGDEETQTEVVKEVISEEEIKPKKPFPYKRILIAVSTIVLVVAASFFIGQLVKKKGTTTEDNPMEIVKPVGTDEDTPGKQKSSGKTDRKTLEEAPVKKVDETPPQKPSTKKTGKVSRKEPAFIKEVKSKGAQVKQIGKDSWEAYYKEYDITMIYIPPGEFTMGQTDEEKEWLIDQIGKENYNSWYSNETPLHKVYLDGYWIGKYEVTFAQYDQYCNDTKREKPDDEGWGRKNRPVINVSWDDAGAYCQWLSKKTGLQFKLPTEAQWEKAARGNDKRKYPWGSSEPDKNLANFHFNIGKTTAVCFYSAGASPYGLLDMAGNVWEWCSDKYDRDYYKNITLKNKNKIIQNPTGPGSGSIRVFRGGSWSDDARSLRCADRGSGRPSDHSDVLGFRLCQDIK